MSVKLKKQKKTTVSKTKTPTNQKPIEEPLEESIESEPVENSTADEENDSSMTEEQVDDGTGLANESPVENDDDDEMDLDGLRKSGEVKPKKKRKKGIIYISNIPKHMNVTRVREILGEYGKIGRVYLQPEKLPGGKTN